MRTSFHHQPEAQHPNSSAIHKLAGRLPHLLERVLAICEKGLGPEHPHRPCPISKMYIVCSTRSKLRLSALQDGVLTWKRAVGWQWPNSSSSAGREAQNQYAKSVVQGLLSLGSQQRRSYFSPPDERIIASFASQKSRSSYPYKL